MISSCEDKIEDFDGFIKPEVIHLLSKSETKNWIRLLSQVDGQPIEGNCSDSLVYQFTYDDKTDTSGLVFVSPKCAINDFEIAYPEIWAVNDTFCNKKPDDCKMDNGYYLAGSWFIDDPVIKNDKVNEIIIKNSFDSLIYTIKVITSLHLEVSTQKNENTIFEKFVAE